MTLETMKPTDDPNFDWVSARSKCTIAAWFSRIKSAAEKNVLTAQSSPDIRASTDHVSFDPGSSTTFSVSRNGKSGETICQVNFVLKGDVIIAERDDAEIYRVTIEWDRARAECALMKNGKHSSLWRICEAALYPLFFES